MRPPRDVEDRGTPSDSFVYSIAALASTKNTPQGSFSELPPGVGPQYVDTTPSGVVRHLTRDAEWSSSRRSEEDLICVPFSSPTTIRLSPND
jgi:hypothetical protein